jgi:hypothetical protein
MGRGGMYVRISRRTGLHEKKVQVPVGEPSVEGDAATFKSIAALDFCPGDRRPTTV